MNVEWLHGPRSMYYVCFFFAIVNECIWIWQLHLKIEDHVTSQYNEHKIVSPKTALNNIDSNKNSYVKRTIEPLNKLAIVKCCVLL